MLRGVVGVPQLGGDEELVPGADPRLQGSPDAFTHLAKFGLVEVGDLVVESQVWLSKVKSQV